MEWPAGHHKSLWAPWRFSYVSSVGTGKGNDCVFCIAPTKSDEEALILYRGKKVYAILNRYPYNNGHTMIVPYRHVASIEDMNEEELAESMRLLKAVMAALREAYAPNGFNVGVNIGKAAGAGIEGHVHIHVVPRWVGDTNYMVVFAGVSVVPQALGDTLKMLKPLVEKHMREMG